jgi:hypothetical protein
VVVLVTGCGWRGTEGQGQKGEKQSEKAGTEFEHDSNILSVCGEWGTILQFDLAAAYNTAAAG